MSTTEELNRLEHSVYAAKDTAGADAIRKYAEAQLRRLDTTLRGCQLEDVKHLQGQCEAYETILKAITTKPFEI